MRLRLPSGSLAVVLAVFAVACGPANTPTAPPKAPAEPKSAIPDADGFAGLPLSVEALAPFHVVLETSIDGEALEPMVLKLWPEAAPQTVRNFLRLCRSGYYDGLGFHRILSYFMVQGGDSAGDGSGSSPFGTVPGEFHSDPAFRHRYGVISMARGNDPNSAGAQFFLICRDGPQAWSLDGRFASFGELVAGASALERIALVPVERGPSGEFSAPTQRVQITHANVLSGPAPKGEPVIAPERAADRWGPPNTVHIQSLWLATETTQPARNRTLDEAQALAESLRERLVRGESLDDLVRAYSEDPVQIGQENPVGFTFAAEGSHPTRGLRAVYEKQQHLHEAFAQLQTEKANGVLDSQQAVLERDRLTVELQRTVRSSIAIPRAEQRSLADAAFELRVGESQVLLPAPGQGRQGVYLIKRLE
ncbi:MAG: peptidylprolyl isomerase [Planctomycetes bacterium]|nr:peptidylprolyl isomerase [Planctomycetota bacterium]MCB9910541.1 peptidylprolyl isomerase [Planctomycetota bacterium]HPF13654.1 peptidylprolyl isomerase [Planctomycetota bacterium]